MRFLKYEEDEELTITSFGDNEVPPYAILSHTWGADGDEVTYVDLETGNSKHKPGYKKILFCGKQAQRDGLLYFWIDTCCIDKNDFAEHSLAIQSMFRWYQNATKCYVYLSDVWFAEAASGSTLEEYDWESAFRSSRWFTRGWTLQELLAPNIVEFFSLEWQKLGDKVSLKALVRKATGIPYDVLDGAPLSWSSVNERLQWKGIRKTKRDEDAWYSLAGILDVKIAPAYGEGAASAFQRLMVEVRKLEDCIRDMHHTDPRDDKRRIEDTKGGIIADSYRWILTNTTYIQWDQDAHSPLLWVRGDPGKGKTMLLCGIIDELYSSLPKTTLMSYFFCQASDSRLNSATAVVRGLLYMLMEQQPSLVSHIRKKHNHAGKSLFEDANAWVALTEIFVDVLRDQSLRPTYLIIDGLDECVTDLPKLLDFLAKQSPTSSCVKWIVSSRNWPDIEAPLERAGHQGLSLELNAESVAAAVNIFIRQKVDELAQEKHFKPEVHRAVLQHLETNADDTFLWVALVCQDLKATPKWNVLKKLYLFPPGLDPLYGRMLNQISEYDGADICRQVLALIAMMYRPIAISELVVLVEELEDLADDLDSVREIIGYCRSFLTLREDTVYFIHQSAKDFLFAKALEEIFPNGTEDVHRVICLRLLATMSRTLHKDMYGVEEWGFPLDNVKPPDPDPLITSRYSCIYWVDHLYESQCGNWANSVNDRHIKDVVNKFLTKQYLYWLEALSLCKSVEQGVRSMTKLWSLVQVGYTNAKCLCNMILMLK
jgi:hypothetical protein